jgi:dTDP-L-rhamnose 4-epimerase
MGRHVLITGGAGFIGSHLADRLLEAGHRVTALDDLCRQVHPERRRPEYLSSDVALIRGDVRDSDSVRRALRGVDAVVHLAAAVGVGQSMYEVAHYTSTNNLGSAVLLEALIERPVERLVVASSMSIYGEGLYETEAGVPCAVGERSVEQLKRHEWEPRAADGVRLVPVPTPETKAPCLASVYALSKYDQERLALLIGQAYGIPTVALRFFNVYGPRQALSNPYTGVLAIFAARLLNGKPPIIFEDGGQRRDFVSVDDVCQACMLALTSPEAAGGVFNVGSGRSSSVLEIAERFADSIGMPDIEPEITGDYRVGDIRHCFADVSRARAVLGYEPTVELEDGLVQLAAWLDGQAAEDGVGAARAELAERGLTL